MPSGGWPHPHTHTPGGETSFLDASPSSFESGFSNNNPHVYLPNLRAHYPSHSSPTLGYNNQQYATYRCDRFCHNQQQGHQHPHPFQQGHQHDHQHEHLQNKEHPEPAQNPFGGARVEPRAYTLPPAMASVGPLSQPPQRYYLPTATTPAGLQSSSAQSLSSPYATGSQSPGSTKHYGSLHSISTQSSSQPFHLGGLNSCGLFRPLGARTNPSSVNYSDQTH